jgi:hypothetical protein
LCDTIQLRLRCRRGRQLALLDKPSDFHQSTKGATIASLRRPATKVMVFQWPCGA